MRELAVVGGGPVGLACALYAVRAGMDVTVFEPRSGNIDKACGEGLMPGAVDALCELGIDPAGRPLAGIRYLTKDRQAQASFHRGIGRGVRRTTLHAAMADSVRAAGVEVVPDAATVVNGDAAVRVNGTDFAYVIAADGLHSPTRRGLALERPSGVTRRFGQRAHVEVEPWTDHVEVHWSAVAEAYVTPVAHDLVGVAVLTTSRRPYLDQLRDFPQLAERLAGRPMSQVRGAGPLRQRSRRRVDGRVLLVGDASGYVDALTGEGIALGLAQGRAAVAAVLARDPQRYARAWRKVSWRYQVLTGALLHASQAGWSRRAIVPAAAALPALFGAVVNELGRPA